MNKQFFIFQWSNEHGYTKLIDGLYCWKGGQIHGIGLAQLDLKYMTFKLELIYD